MILFNVGSAEKILSIKYQIKIYTQFLNTFYLEIKEKFSIFCTNS